MKNPRVAWMNFGAFLLVVGLLLGIIPNGVDAVTGNGNVFLQGDYKDGSALLRVEA
jgi:hypothetical protein